MPDWCQRESTPSGVTIRFLPSADRYWDPRVLAERPIDFSDLDGISVELTGAGAVWMYAYAAAGAARGGAAEIKARTPASTRDQTIARLSSVRSTRSPTDASRCQVEISLDQSDRLTDDAVAWLLDSAWSGLTADPPRDVCLTGRAGPVAYARGAELASRSGVEWITCLTPTDGLVIVAAPDPNDVGKRILVPDWLLELRPRVAQSRIVGIAADPRSGKSQFSQAFDRVLSSSGLRAWRIDCDGMAPTPPWYLELEASVGPDLARPIREDFKRNWTDQMEQHIAWQLPQLRDYFELVIADLPGGNLKAVPEQRIPPGRERIFEKIDGFILLDRIDKPRETRWRAELARHGLESRIVCVLSSSDPKGPPRLEIQPNGEILRGAVTGLDRGQKIDALAKAYSPAMTEILIPRLLAVAHSAGA